ncbi:hypothetical protein PSTT_14766 [Puccinia striiformis]|uniref:Transaldolase n=1 Tax=Puccinia striiformis TaxID=27350 RepID=A0A2S4UKV7_9BASI|nr:hypothetical protein PSTT_14766 [Puccinia striiformis]
MECNAQTTPDATTNPFLIFAAVEKPTCAQLIDVAVKYGKSQGVLITKSTLQLTDIWSTSANRFLLRSQDKY